jgi:hypothetical protein
MTVRTLIFLALGASGFIAHASALTFEQSGKLSDALWKAYEKKQAYEDVIRDLTKEFGEPWSKSAGEAKWVVKLEKPLCREVNLTPPPDPKFPLGSGGGVADPEACKKHKPLTKAQVDRFQSIVMKARFDNLKFPAVMKQLEKELGKRQADKFNGREAAIWYWIDSTESLCKGMNIKKEPQNPAGFVQEDFNPPAEACKGA